MNKKRLFILLLIAIQVCYLLFLTLSYYSISWYGKEITLKTAPVDPSDLFRGDYVILNYDINEVNADLWKEKDNINDHSTLYVTLQRKGTYFNVTGLSSTKPSSLLSNAVVMKARLDYADNEHIYLTYGIEQYYVEDNTGEKWEKKRGLFDVNVKVTSWGQAISSIAWK